MFHSDYGSGIKLTPGQAIKQKRQNGGRRAWPDMFIAKSCEWFPYQCRLPLLDQYERYAAQGIYCYDLDCDELILHGLFLELKKEGTRLKKRNGDWATPHIAEQAAVLEKLRSRGYCAEFAVGFEEAKRIIDEYLGKE